MNIYTMPDELTSDTEQELLLLNYQTSSTNVKNKVSMKKNVFCFLLEGMKGVIAEEKAVTINNEHFIIIGSGNSLMTEYPSAQKVYRSILFFFDDSTLINFCNEAKISRPQPHVHQAYSVIENDEYIRQFVSSLTYLLAHNLNINKKLYARCGSK